jgi:hypothetical protein
MKYLIVIFVLVLGIACSNDYSNAKPSVNYSKAKEVRLPDDASYAIKRGFGDMNGDGIEDMVEIVDEKIIGTDYNAYVFEGYKKNNTLYFKSRKKIKIGLNVNWLTSMSKFDVADINGDGLCEVIVTQFSQGLFSTKYSMFIGINQGGYKFKKAKSFTKNNYPLETCLMNIFISIDNSLDDEDIREVFKMDWGDMNGDGNDDIVFIHVYNGKLEVETWLSNSTKDKISFYDGSTCILNKATYQIPAHFFDVEDFNGDGLYDLVSYKPRFGTDITLFNFENVSNGSFKLIKRKPVTFEEIEMNYFGFEKRDGIDMNFDGKTDYIHAGTKNGYKYISYNLVK